MHPRNINLIKASKCSSELLDLGSQNHLQTLSITASNCIFELLDRGLQLPLQTCSMTACKFISWVTSSRHPNVSPIPLDHGLYLQLWGTQSRPPNASPNALDHGLQVHLWVNRSRPPNTSPNPLNHSLKVHVCVQPNLGPQVHLQTHSIAAAKYISSFTPSLPPSASLSSLNQHLEVLLRLCSSTVCNQIGHMYIYRET